ncbi:glycosyltransferase family 4 protein [Methylobacterium currus]|uniref:glycosyltransferase family 4 protein n=1 Tax=Methylobacterium currus TaxID=2051553 RepID=UPI001E52C9AA|nr:glycosyltransferase family 4 protein [Methylobacterium currus]UHC19522.1 glycosyltransferase family 4 protein [Methylobacterium currus]
MKVRQGLAADLLVEVADRASDPEGLITKYVQFESFRLLRERHLHDMSGTLQDRLKVLMWYLVDYVAHRSAKFEMPLSAEQIRFLNSPMPIAGVSPAVTVALYNFVARELPTHIRLDQTEILKEALYWWCTQKAPISKLDRFLITDEQTALLRLEEKWQGQDYAFNYFMARSFENDKDMLGLDGGRTADRAAYFYYLLLRSYTQPHILRLLPQDAVRRVMRLDQGGASTFDRVLAQLALPPGSGASDGKALRERGEALLRQAEIAPRHGPDRNAPSRGCGEYLIQRRDLSGPREAGLALIGPLHQTSGLGQATRLSYEILGTCEAVKPTALPFGLDNPAPIGFASDLAMVPFDRPREITLIHLNAESIPLVFAFEQGEILSDGYNIGYFFWELDKLPKCQQLGLELVDEIWVSSEYNREIYARNTSKPVINVGMAVEALPDVVPASLANYGIPEGGTVFLTTFDSFSFIERKNPIATIEAFLAAFPDRSENATLIVKTQNRTRVPDPYQVELWKRIDQLIKQDPRIILMNETLRYGDLLALKKACDCYVSLHRSEGWGFGMIEAMQLGCPVIATAYGGNMDFCTPETAYLIDYDLVGVRTEEYIFVERGSQWADPNVTQAAAAMRRVASDKAAARAKGEQAARFVTTHFSVPAIARRYGRRLEEIRAQRAGSATLKRAV